MSEEKEEMEYEGKRKEGKRRGSFGENGDE